MIVNKNRDLNREKDERNYIMRDFWRDKRKRKRKIDLEEYEIRRVTFARSTIIEFLEFPIK